MSKCCQLHHNNEKQLISPVTATISITDTSNNLSLSYLGIGILKTDMGPDLPEDGGIMDPSPVSPFRLHHRPRPAY